MNMHFNTTGLLSKKALAALLICLVLPIASVRADQPISSGTEIFHGYDIFWSIKNLQSLVSGKVR